MMVSLIIWDKTGCEGFIYSDTFWFNSISSQPWPILYLPQGENGYHLFHSHLPYPQTLHLAHPPWPLSPSSHPRASVFPLFWATQSTYMSRESCQCSLNLQMMAVIDNSLGSWPLSPATDTASAQQPAELRRDAISQLLPETGVSNCIPQRSRGSHLRKWERV